LASSWEADEPAAACGRQWSGSPDGREKRAQGFLIAGEERGMEWRRSVGGASNELHFLEVTEGPQAIAASSS